MNRLLHQFLRDGQLTFRKKWRDLVIQIFGHEGLYDNQAHLADVGACYVFDLNFYRLSDYKYEDLALRKLLNPFKWAEFLIAAPLELLAWSFGRTASLLFGRLKSNCKTIGLGKGFLIFLLAAIALISFPFVNLAVNLITGVARRILAPVRYLIRPSIELAKLQPKTFLAILALTLGLAAFVAISIFTGGLPLVALGGVFFASLGAQVLTTMVATVAIWASLLKGVRTIRELGMGLFGAKSTEKEQFARVDKLNGQSGYGLNTIRLTEMPEHPALDRLYREQIPLLIEWNKRLWIYGAAPKGQTRLTEIKNPETSTRQFAREGARVYVNKVPAPGEPVRLSARKSLDIYFDENGEGDGRFFYLVPNPAPNAPRYIVKTIPNLADYINLEQCDDKSKRYNNEERCRAILAVTSEEGDTDNYDIPENTVQSYKSRDIHQDVYTDIADCRGHFIPRSRGTTVHVSEALHGVNPVLSKLRRIDRQSIAHRFTLLAGLESVCATNDPIEEDVPVDAAGAEDANFTPVVSKAFRF